MDYNSPQRSKSRSFGMTFLGSLVVIIISLQLLSISSVSAQSRSTQWGKVDVPEDIPDDFDFAKMLFKKVRSPFSEQNLEVDERLENGQEAQINWNFDPNHKYGPQRWKNYYPSCGGNRQSPMDLSSCQNASSMARLRLTEMNTRPTEVNITNNGHSIQYSMKYPDDRVPLLSGGPLKSKYQFEQLHFHWGLKNNEGSEHTINKRASAMEMHVLFRNTKYDSVAEATSFRDGLSVLGFLFEVSEADQMGFLKNLDQLREVGSTIQIKGVSTGFRMKDIVRSLQQDFIAYQGSLTTPPCSEAVSWLVARDPMKISRNDMIAFRKIYALHELLMAPNFRPLQARNNRFCLNF